jgi:hypothetical protein
MVSLAAQSPKFKEFMTRMQYHKLPEQTFAKYAKRYKRAIFGIPASFVAFFAIIVVSFGAMSGIDAANGTKSYLSMDDLMKVSESFCWEKCSIV